MGQITTTNLMGHPIALVLNRNEAFMHLQSASECGYSAIFCNVHMLMLARTDRQLAQAMDQADLLFADGAPVAWLQGKIEQLPAVTVRGYQAMLNLCGDAEAKGQSIGLYGSTERVLVLLERRLQEQYPRLDIAWRHAPPFAKDEIVESDAVLDEIARSGIRHLFVALGCPKQEKWLKRHREKLNCNVLAVGAAFDWLAGVEPMAPGWMEQAGLIWLHRWLRHPLRHFRRYGYYNVKFVFLALAEWLRSRR